MLLVLDMRIGLLDEDAPRCYFGCGGDIRLLRQAILFC
jgi:hypothetical protein